MKSLLLTLLLFSGVSQSAVIFVNSDDDNRNNTDGLCNLNEAIVAASFDFAVDGCAAGDPDNGDWVVIQVPGPIQLTGEIDVLAGMRISNPIGGNPVQIIAAPNRRIFDVHPVQSDEDVVEFSGLHLVGGNPSSGNGGAINIYRSQSSASFNYATILIEDMIFENNQAARGGAVSLFQTYASQLTIRDNVFMSNSATDTGGALSIDRGSAEGLILRNNHFENNQATNLSGATLIAHSSTEDATIDDNRFYRNISDGSAGGMYLSAINNNQKFIMNRNAFIGNTAADDGGAMYVGLNAQAWVYNSVMAMNMANRGGAISTVAGPQPNNVWLYMYHSTLAFNHANFGASYYAHGGSLGSIGASILAYPQGDDNCGGSTAVINTHRNSIDDSSCPYNASSDRREDPLLAGLSFDEGGWPALTPTMDSSAIDSVPSASCLFYGPTALNDDQQNNPRPVDGDGDGTSDCDIGAIEVPIDHDLLWSDGFGG